VQAGGNVGIFPMEFAKVFEVVLTFEPIPINFECMMRNINRMATNEERQRIRMADWALGAKYGAAKINYNQHNPAASWLTEPKRGETVEVQEPGDVAVVQLDYMQLQALDLLQLDVEGYELAALEGAYSHIAHFRPVIIMEMCRHALHPESVEELNRRRELLRSLDYAPGYEVGRMVDAYDEVFYPNEWAYEKLKPFVAPEGLKPRVTRQGWKR
jgi:FkbM family methyltransferase